MHGIGQVVRRNTVKQQFRPFCGRVGLAVAQVPELLQLGMGFARGFAGRVCEGTESGDGPGHGGCSVEDVLMPVEHQVFQQDLLVAHYPLAPVCRERL